MQFKRCSNPTCRRPFQVNEFAGRNGGDAQPQMIICPHCGHGETRSGGSVFLVHAMSSEEEAEFNTINPLDAEESAEDSA